MSASLFGKIYLSIINSFHSCSVVGELCYSKHFWDLCNPKSLSLSTCFTTDIFLREIQKIVHDETDLHGDVEIICSCEYLETSLLSVTQTWRRDLREYTHRMIEPRERQTDDLVYIMWVSTSTDMTAANWIPNHVGLVLPIQVVSKPTHQDSQIWRQ